MNKLANIMTARVVTVNMDDTVDHIRDLFGRHGFHHLLVVDNGHAVGLISDRDLLKNLSPFIGKLSERQQDAFCLKRRAHQVMTRSLVWAPPDTSITDAVTLLLAHGISCLPVLDEHHHIMGIVTWRDLLRSTLLSPNQSGSEASPSPEPGSSCPVGDLPESFIIVPDANSESPAARTSSPAGAQGGGRFGGPAWLDRPVMKQPEQPERCPDLLHPLKFRVP